MATSKAKAAAPKSVRKTTPRTLSRKLELVTPAAKAPKAETPIAAASPKAALARPKPADPNAFRLTGKEMRTGMYALRCGDKYLPHDLNHKKLTENLAEAHLDDNWSVLKSRGRRLSKILYPLLLPAPLEPVKLIFTTNGLVTTTKPYLESPWDDMERRTYRGSEMHNSAIAQAAELEDRSFDQISINSFHLQDSAMWPYLMNQYERELEAELAEDDPEAKGDAMRWLAARLFLAGSIYGVRAAKNKREDEADERRMKRARQKSDRRLRENDLEAYRRATRD